MVNVRVMIKKEGKIAVLQKNTPEKEGDSWKVFSVLAGGVHLQSPQERR